MSNDFLVLVAGESAGGKSASLRNISEPEKVLYLNTEAGKKLPFRSKFKEVTIIDPYQIPQAIQQVQGNDKYHTIIIDSATFMMDMFETQHVLGSSNTMQGWSNYQQYFKKLLQQDVAASDKRIVFTAHNKDELDESTMTMKTSIPVKGALKGNGMESYFSCVVYARKIATKDLKDYENDLLVITDEEEALGYKYVYQTKIDKKTVNTRIRSPLGMWDSKETFIDNDINLVFNRLKEYYQ